MGLRIVVWFRLGKWLAFCIIIRKGRGDSLTTHMNQTVVPTDFFIYGLHATLNSRFSSCECWVREKSNKNLVDLRIVNATTAVNRLSSHTTIRATNDDLLFSDPIQVDNTLILACQQRYAILPEAPIKYCICVRRTTSLVDHFAA